MAPFFYALCAVAAAFCAALLLRGYVRTRYRLLFWGGLCFLGLTGNNTLLMLDKFVFPDVNLSTWRLLVALIGLLLMLYGVVWDAE
ncbi:MAG TPA: DUF5985 family protein [Candidatus Binatia bacterium]|jgi:hypothetical protein